MSNHGMRILTGLLALLVALAGGTAASGTHVSTTNSLASDAGTATGEAGLYDDGNYADLDQSAATDEGAGMVNTDASLAEVGDERGLWAWLSVHWGAFVARLGEVTGLAGLAAPAADGGVDVWASEEGVDVDARVGGVDLDATPAGDVDGKTWEAAAQAEEAKSQLPPAPGVPVPRDLPVPPV